MLIDQMIKVNRFSKPAQGKVKKLPTNGLIYMDSEYILPSLQGSNSRLCDILGLVVGGISCAMQNLPPIQNHGDVLVVMKGEKKRLGQLRQPDFVTQPNIFGLPLCIDDRARGINT